MRLETDGRVLAALAMVTQLGFIMAAAILFGFLLGWYLDNRFGTEWIFTAVFLLTGIGGGGITVYRMIMASLEESEQEDGPGEEPRA